MLLKKVLKMGHDRLFLCCHIALSFLVSCSDKNDMSGACNLFFSFMQCGLVQLLAQTCLTVLAPPALAKTCLLQLHPIRHVRAPTLMNGPHPHHPPVLTKNPYGIMPSNKLHLRTPARLFYSNIITEACCRCKQLLNTF